MKAITYLYATLVTFFFQLRGPPLTWSVLPIGHIHDRCLLQHRKNHALVLCLIGPNCTMSADWPTSPNGECRGMMKRCLMQVRLMKLIEREFNCWIMSECKSYEKCWIVSRWSVRAVAWEVLIIRIFTKISRQRSRSLASVHWLWQVWAWKL